MQNVYAFFIFFYFLFFIFSLFHFSFIFYSSTEDLATGRILSMSTKPMEPVMHPVWHLSTSSCNPTFSAGSRKMWRSLFLPRLALWGKTGIKL